MSISRKSKVAVTGHTRGIGLSIFQTLQRNNFTVEGFSRSNGFDLADVNQRQAVINHIATEYDCFINNAYPFRGDDLNSGYAQVDLLNRLWCAWRGHNKLIVNIGSDSSDIVKRKFHPYSIHKKALADTCIQLRTTSPLPHVVLLRPGYVDTSLTASIDVPKLNPQEVADIVLYILHAPLKINDISFTV